MVKLTDLYLCFERKLIDRDIKSHGDAELEWRRKWEEDS